MTVGQAFDETVEYYDQWMRTALPRYDELFSIAVNLIPFERDQPIKILDLGAGTGLFSFHVWSQFPQAIFTLYDIAPKMLDVARLRFQQFPGQFQYEVVDNRDLQGADLFDVVISSLSIHHLEHTEKQKLFSAIHTCLREGGVFINVDQVKGPTREMQDLYWTNWLAHVREQGAAEEQIQASIHRRKTYDKDALLVDQLRWLREASFDTVDCVYKHYFMGVFYAKK